MRLWSPPKIDMFPDMQPESPFVVAFNSGVLLSPDGRLAEDASATVGAMRDRGAHVVVLSPQPSATHDVLGPALNVALADVHQTPSGSVRQLVEQGQEDRAVVLAAEMVRGKAAVLADAGVYAYVANGMDDMLAAHEAGALPVAIGAEAAAGVDFMFDHPSPVQLQALADLPAWLSYEPNLEEIRSWGPGARTALARAVPSLEEIAAGHIHIGDSTSAQSGQGGPPEAAALATYRRPRGSGEGGHAPGA